MNNLRIIIALLVFIQIIRCNKYNGQFFASSDQQKTLVYLNHTLFIEKVDVQSQRHIQYKQAPFVFDSRGNETLTPVTGIIYGDYSIISKDMEIYIHVINQKRGSLEQVQKIDLKNICLQDNVDSSQGQFDDVIKQYQYQIKSYCNDNLTLDFIESIHIYHRIIFFKTHLNAFIFNIDLLFTQISKPLIQNTLSSDLLLKSLIVYQNYQIISENDNHTNYDKNVEFFKIKTNNMDLLILQNKLSLRNQIIIPLNLTQQFFAHTLQCQDYIDFDMVYSQSSIQFDKGYYIMLRCEQTIKLLLINQERIVQIYQDESLSQSINQSYNSVYLLNSNDQHIYAFYQPNQACFYQKPENNNKKFLSQKEDNSVISKSQLGKAHHICITNHIQGSAFSNILYNEYENKITVILSHQDQNTDIVGLFIDRCKFANINESIDCDIYKNSSTCNNYFLDQCGNRFMMMRFNLITVMMIIFLIVISISIIKSMLSLVRPFLKLIGDILIFIICKIPRYMYNLTQKLFKIIRIKCRKFRIKISTLLHVMFRSKKGKLNEEQEDICPICMEALSIRPIKKFVCQNHSAHIDCIEEYNNSKESNNQPLDCPFRDTLQSNKPNPNIELQNQIDV